MSNVIPFSRPYRRDNGKLLLTRAEKLQVLAELNRALAAFYTHMAKAETQEPSCLKPSL